MAGDLGWPSCLVDVSFNIIFDGFIDMSFNILFDGFSDVSFNILFDGFIDLSFNILFDGFPVQCRIESITYTACGNSTNKKDAQANCANDMCQYLVRTKEMNAAEVPNLAVSFSHPDVHVFC